MIKIPLLAIISIVLVASDAMAAERYKIRDDRRQVIGDVYDPGHGRRLQIRDTRRRMLGYITRNGDVTDPQRRKRLEIELLPELDKE